MALKNNLLANYLGQGWAGIMGLAFIPLYIQYLGVEAYGLIGLFAVLQVWLNLLDMGMSPTLGREMSRFAAGGHTPTSIQDLLRSIELVVFGMTLLITSSVWWSADWIAKHWLQVNDLPVEAVAGALSVTALVIGLRFCEGLYKSAIFGMQRQVWFNLTHALFVTLRFGGAVAVLAFLSPTVEAFFLWQAAISLLAVLTYAIKVHSLMPPAPRSPRLSWPALAGVWRFAGGLLAINAMGVALTQIDKVLLSNLLPLEEFGCYIFVTTAASAFGLLVSPVTQAIYPRLVGYLEQNNAKGFAELYHTGAQAVTLVTVPLMVLVLLYSTPLLYVWTGDAEFALKVSALFLPVMLGNFLNGLMWMPAQAQFAYGWTRLGITINFLSLCVLIPALFLLVPEFGALAAAWLWVTLNAGYTLIAIPIMHRHILQSEKWTWYLADVALPTLGALIVGYSLAVTISPDADSDRWCWGLFLLGTALLILFSMLRFSNRLWPLTRSFADNWLRRLTIK